MARRSEEEQFASLLMSRALGVPVECVDDGSTDGMWDFRIEYPGGERGAGEMTRITSGAAREWLGLNRKGLRLEGSELAWIVRSANIHPPANEVRGHIAAIAPLAAAVGVTDFDKLWDYEHIEAHPSFTWLHDHQLDVSGWETSALQGRLFFQGPIVAQFVGKDLDPVLTWLENELTDLRYDSKFKKLARAGTTDQHLVLRIDMQGMPPAELLTLTDDEASLPTRPPSVLGKQPLTGLWLMPEYGQMFLWWTERHGWNRTEINSGG